MKEVIYTVTAEDGTEKIYKAQAMIDTSNEETEEVTNLVTFINRVTYQLCDKQEDLTSLKEYIRLTAVDNQTLRIEQNLIINCCSDSISARLLQNDLNIIVDISNYGIQCNCMCPGFVNYDIVGLMENKTYLFTFKRNNYERYTESIIFTADLNQTIELK